MWQINRDCSASSSIRISDPRFQASGGSKPLFQAPPKRDFERFFQTIRFPLVYDPTGQDTC